MKQMSQPWTKTELQVYILLLCANADNEETVVELKLIKSKVSGETFDKMYKIFNEDSEKKRFKKIDRDIHLHTFSNLELSAFRKELYEIFLSDSEFKMMERRLDGILDNILY